MTSRAHMPLGKAPYVHDRRSLLLGRYLAPTTPPTHWEWGQHVKTWPMFLNDTLGDCTCAAVGHLLESFSADNGIEVTVTDDEILAAYEAVSGYDPTTGANDNGAEIVDVLKYWKNTGVAGNKLGAFAEVDPHNHEEVKNAIYTFGGIDVGVQLPLAAQSMTQWRMPKRIPKLTGNWAVGSWGGHCIPAIDYSPTGVTVVTWGEVLVMGWEFWDTYVDEAWACIDSDFLEAGESPQGLNLAQLTADLGAI